MLDALISAGANLLGNLFNVSSTKDNNAAMIAAQQQMNAQNIALQKEFAQKGIQWKVQDAQAAGLHPLAALGATTSSFSPLSVGNATEAPKVDFSSLGQDLSRAAKAMSSQAQREAVDEERSRKLDLEAKALDNDIKRSALASRGMSTSRGGGQLGPSLEGVPWVRGTAGAPFTRTTGTDRLPVDEDKMKQAATDLPTVKRLPLWGLFEYGTNPHRASAQKLEDEYGEDYVGGALSAGNLPADLLWSVRNNEFGLHPALKAELAASWRRLDRWGRGTSIWNRLGGR